MNQENSNKPVISQEQIEDAVITEDYVMRDLKLLLETLKETGRSGLAGQAYGWRFNLERISDDKEELQ